MWNRNKQYITGYIETVVRSVIFSICVLKNKHCLVCELAWWINALDWRDQFCYLFIRPLTWVTFVTLLLYYVQMQIICINLHSIQRDKHTLKIVRGYIYTQLGMANAIVRSVISHMGSINVTY